MDVNEAIDIELANIIQETFDGPDVELLIHEVGIGKKENLGISRTSEVTGKTVINYVDTETFCLEIVKWNIARKDAIENGKSIPPMPNTIGAEIINIANGIGSRHNFRNYTYVDEMIDDGILSAVKAVKNFNPEKSSNPFGYFTLVIWRAFLTRIKVEKLAHETKMSLLMDPSYMFFDGEDEGHHINKDQAIDFITHHH